MRCQLYSFVFGAAMIYAVAAFPNSRSLQRRKNVERPNVAGLDHCPGRSIGDADACTFEQQSELPDRVKWFQFGQAVENCDNPNAPDITSTISTSHTTTETWEHTDGVEFDFLGVKIGGEGGWAESTEKTQSQSLEITVPAGKQKVAVVGVNHKETQGRIRINYGDPSGEPGSNDFHFIYFQNDIISTQPKDDPPVYDSREFDCGEPIVIDASGN
ncbi:hypothetical protein K435DRAFT_974570 [Dendrothele bispora CBS 962.96]|uniref:Uncharacterized protein n=1 Tax=Dendrothele bispora (strain CBS 962.96) TaxID=1314807 RepID=A0A4V6T4V2_DENBC|nr:hypothetical protein K435DRAFT_974570 [Dendrothele bispora CBS 962.96]